MFILCIFATKEKTMIQQLSLIKGIHPGIILERELQKRSLPKGSFALSVGEYPQTLVSIMKGKRRMNPALSLQIEKVLGWEEGFLMVLQAYYDIACQKKKETNSKPDLSKLRPALFWDTDIRSIDWERQKPSVFKRVLERGNEEEIKEIIRFYGEDDLQSRLHSFPAPLAKRAQNYLHITR